MRYSLFIIVSFFIGTAHAADFKNLHVEYRDGIYTMSADIFINAPPAEVRYVITDYDHLDRISGAVKKSQFLARPAPDTAVFFMQLEMCFGVFCQDIRQVLRMDESQPHTLTAIALPEYSNVTSAKTLWQMRPCNGGTCLHWESTMKPKFWLPPLIGPAMVEATLRDFAHYTAQGIEKLAREWAVIHGTAQNPTSHTVRQP
ncbi:MAG TPA: SRPBCC family protein [Gammaproteobacteria bacterium]|nr:SRPBCC family protein [Gammaproteobacteria bacterium]